MEYLVEFYHDSEKVAVVKTSLAKEFSSPQARLELALKAYKGKDLTYNKVVCGVARKVWGDRVIQGRFVGAKQVEPPFEGDWNENMMEAWGGVVKGKVVLACQGGYQVYKDRITHQGNELSLQQVSVVDWSARFRPFIMDWIESKVKEREIKVALLFFTDEWNVSIKGMEESLLRFHSLLKEYLDLIEKGVDGASSEALMLPQGYLVYSNGVTVSTRGRITGHNVTEKLADLEGQKGVIGKHVDKNFKDHMLYRTLNSFSRFVLEDIASEEKQLDLCKDKEKALSFVEQLKDVMGDTGIDFDEDNMKFMSKIAVDKDAEQVEKEAEGLETIVDKEDI
jgi:hypothetical protein